MLQEFQPSKDRQVMQFPHFPTRMQAVVWRNWGLVSSQRIASVIQATEEQLSDIVSDLGLPPVMNSDEQWLQRGYITIIRANWHLLPYEQLLELLGWSAEKLSFTLQEDDFLWVKLGSMKPWMEPVIYKKLTLEERSRTMQIKRELAMHFPLPKLQTLSSADTEKPFDFLKQFSQSVPTISNYRAEPDEIELSASWTIRYPQDANDVEVFVKRFVSRHEKAWGVELQTAPSSESRIEKKSGYELHLLIHPTSELPKESHTVEVEEKRIRVIAVDEQGLLRALQWLTQQMKERGGPILKTGSFRRTTKFELRFIYSYCAVYGDPLLDPDLDPYPDELLERLSDSGINGIWLQSVMYQLIPWEAAPELSEHWERRIAGLRRLTARAALYGIGIYLYFNEPRAMPLVFFDDKPEWKGHVRNGYAALCISHPEVQDILKEGTARLFREVPRLSGLFTITMSENLTNCYSHALHGITNCPRCSWKSPQEVTVEINRLIAEGAFREKPDARIICFTWGWVPALGWTQEQVKLGIEGLPEGVSVMCISEDKQTTNVAGVEGKVSDYSMSIVGPSDKSKQIWRKVQERGLQTVAKVQINNTWECSAVPCLPVFQLIAEHLDRLSEFDVNGLMLSWTLGGYPSLNLELAAGYYWEEENERGPKVQEILACKFGTAAGDYIAAASAAFSSAFQEFPFNINVLYYAPQTYGPANLLYLHPTGFKASMIGFPYDDLDKWRGIYSVAQFAGQWKKLYQGWKKGLDLMAKAQKHLTRGSERDYAELMYSASAAFLHFQSTYLQVKFVIVRERFLQTNSFKLKKRIGQQLSRLLDAEILNAKRLYQLILQDSRIGYEASNHYYYTLQDMQEKVINCLHIKEEIQQNTT